MTTPRTGSRVRPGTEPSTARTVVWLRMVLSSAALIAFSVAAWVLLDAPGSAGPSTDALTVGGLCVLVALIAAADLVVLALRSARGEYRNN